MLGPISFREIQGKMELLGLQGPQDPLGPGALLATPGKMAPGELPGPVVREDVELDHAGRDYQTPNPDPRTNPTSILSPAPTQTPIPITP